MCQLLLYVPVNIEDVAVNVSGIENFPVTVNVGDKDFLCDATGHKEEVARLLHGLQLMIL